MFLFTLSQTLRGEVRGKEVSKESNHKLIYSVLHELKATTDPIFLEPYYMDIASNNLCHPQTLMKKESAGNT